MKNMLKSSVIILSLFCIVLFKKCGKTTFQKHEIGMEEGIIVEKLSLEHLKSNKLVLNKLNEIESKLTAKKKEDKNNSLYDFIIGTDEVIYIKDGCHHSYTFPIIRPEVTLKTENMVLTHEGEGNCKAYLSRYALNRKQIVNFDKEGSLEGKMTINELQGIEASVFENEPSQPCHVLVKVPVVWNKTGVVTRCLEWTMKQNCKENLPDGDTELKIVTTPMVRMSFTSFFESFKTGIITVPVNSIWWRTTKSEKIIRYLQQHFDEETGLEDPEVTAFATWAVRYLARHPDVTWEQFENWFLTPNEGKDGEYDSKFWSNPNIRFPRRKLPSYRDFRAAFPKIQEDSVLLNMPSDKVYRLVGGTMLRNHLLENPNYQNACAIRGSRAFNYSGINIGVVEDGGFQKTEKGSDDKNYILSAKAFNMWMKKTFGKPTYRLSATQIKSNDDIVNFLKDKTGIYTIVNNSTTKAGYSGHVDLITNGHCLESAKVKPKGGIKVIEIWELKK